MGEPYWNQGYCTEAANTLVGFAFANLGLIKITSHHMASNPASGKVMLKLGMKKEGYFEKHFLKFGVLQDMIFYGLLKDSNSAWQKK